jgi:2-iminobutanoate/2-iminopropanoate deaminase
MARPLATLALAALLATPLRAQTPKEVVPIPGASNPVLSAVVRAGDVLHLSGQLGTVPGQGLVPGGITAETRQTLENIKRIVEAAGSSMERVVKCTVFLADIADFRAMNEVYRTFFPADPPARSTVAVAGLVLNARIEIECLALAGR